MGVHFHYHLEVGMPHQLHGFFLADAGIIEHRAVVVPEDMGGEPGNWQCSDQLFILDGHGIVHFLHDPLPHLYILRLGERFGVFSGKQAERAAFFQKFF